jgi:hypothetical protein
MSTKDLQPSKSKHAGKRRKSRRRQPWKLVLAAQSALWLMAPGSSTAQQPLEPGSAAADAVYSEPLSSSETGQTPLEETFGTRAHADWVRETRRKAWKDTTFDTQIRSYDIDRSRYDGSESEAWALGGSAGLKTGYFRERFAFGATGYTSQKLHGPEDKDGTLLLAPGQHGYTVLGELYGELLVSEGTRLGIGRRGIDTPYLNRNDSRMTPNTFEAVTLQGVYGGDGRAEWRAGGGYFDKIKTRNSDEFISMATAAGAPGAERGVYVAGFNYKLDDFSIGAIDYFSDDIINIFYGEMKYAWPLADGLRLRLALQYSAQRSTGDNLLRGADFSASQWGSKVELAAGGALFTAAFTSVGGDTGMQAPWSGHPGYTSVQMEDFFREGENALLLRAAYNFKSVSGLSVYGLWVNGSTPSVPGQFAKEEYDLNLQWSPDSGVLEGLMVRLRFAHATQEDSAGSDQDDLRLMVFYDPSP